jgi:hypothetical protein
MRDLFDRYNDSHTFDYFDRKKTTKIDRIRELIYGDFKSHATEMFGSRTDNRIKKFETEARANINNGLKPYTKGKHGELNGIYGISETDDENLILAFVSQKLRNPSPVILWYHPTMVKLATPHIDSRIKGIEDYEKIKADLYQAIEDLEHTHKGFLEKSEKTIESVLKRGHNFMI